MLLNIFHGSEEALFILTNVRLSNVGILPDKIFFKAKTSGKDYYTSEKIPLKDHGVVWPDTVRIRGKIAKRGIFGRAKRLRLSFRVVATNKNGFDRYGHVEIDTSKIQINSDSSVSLFLSKCRDDAKFTCNIKIVINDDSDLAKTAKYSSDFGRVVAEPREAKTGASTDNNVSRFMSAPCADTTHVTIVKDDCFLTCPFKCTREEYDRLEREVDAIIGRVIADMPTA